MIPMRDSASFLESVCSNGYLWELRRGNDLTIMAHPMGVKMALRAAEELHSNGTESNVCVVFDISKLNLKCLTPSTDGKKGVYIFIGDEQTVDFGESLYKKLKEIFIGEVKIGLFIGAKHGKTAVTKETETVMEDEQVAHLTEEIMDFMGVRLKPSWLE